MLPRSKYIFKKYEISDKNKYIVYGDNIQESTQIIEWFCDFNKDVVLFESIEYASLSEYIYVFKINNEIFYFVARSYFRHGKLPDEVRRVIKELDKPDAVIYSVEKEKVIMGFETTSTTMAGNATWQRSGRIINFLEAEIPFGFLAYFSKLDKSDKNINKKPRTASKLFVLSFIALSLKYHVPALLGFFEHPDKKQNIDELNPREDWRGPIFNYLLDLILGTDSTLSLRKCYKNMKDYYFLPDKNKERIKEFGIKALSYIENDNFEDNIISAISTKTNVPLFNESFSFKWRPKKILKRVSELFSNIEFYQISKNCRVGITFETKKIVEVLNKKREFYTQDCFTKGVNNPTIIIPIKLTKWSNKENKFIPTDDPYNGEISAFSNIYLQSFPNSNILLLLTDHTGKEYIVEDSKKHKIYKAIDKYADVMIDMNLNWFSVKSENSKIDSKSKYEKEFITEDDVTSFFGTVLLKEGIKPSFINPPSGSWSDIHLYPTNKYIYYNKEEERGDIAYYYNGVYYVGESKKNSKLFYKKLDEEFRKTKNLGTIISNELNNEYPIKYFALFNGTYEQAKKIVEESQFDYAVIVNDSEAIHLEIVEK